MYRTTPHNHVRNDFRWNGIIINKMVALLAWDQVKHEKCFHKAHALCSVLIII